MALSFAKKLAPQPTQPAATQADTTQKPKLVFGGSKTQAAAPGPKFGSKPVPTQSPAKTTVKTPGATASWMKKGPEAHAAMAAADAQAEKARAEAGKLWRFWMPAGQDRIITFLDGDLDADNMLDVPMFREHKIKVNGQWDTAVCVSENEPCPLCEAGDSRASLVGALTCIDHHPYTVQKGPNAGKTIEHSRKLYVATRQTLKLLSKQAKAAGGTLAGCTFEVSRTGDKEPAVGNSFVFQEKNDLDDIQKATGLKTEDCVPADYEHEIEYRSAAELAELGYAKPVHKGVGSEKGVDTKALKKEL